MGKLTNKQKEALAFEVMSVVGNIIEFGTFRDNEVLKNVEFEEIKDQLAKWMQTLPGKLWDTRLS